MIRSFKHKGLEQFFKSGSRRGVPQQLTKRLEVQLDVLNRARELRDMALPGFNLHPLKGDRKNAWAIKVNANRRIVFVFKDGDIDDVDFVDYHSVRISSNMLSKGTRRPSHPGAVLAEILPESGLNQTELAKLMGVSRRLVNEIINERRNVTPDVAHRLAAVFNTTPDLWLGLQADVDIWDAANDNRKHYTAIRSRAARRANTPEVTLTR